MKRKTVSDEKEMVERRIERLCSHLGAQSLTEEYQLAMASCAKVMVKFPVSSVVLTDYMKGKHRCLQEKILQYFRDRLELQTPVEISKDEHQELTMRQLQRLVREAGIRPLKALLEDPYQYSAITEAAGTIDLSLAIKLGVQFSLCGAVMNLGTQKHRDKYYAGIENLYYPGCFAMTELRQADRAIGAGQLRFSGAVHRSGQRLERLALHPG